MRRHYRFAGFSNTITGPPNSWPARRGPIQKFTTDSRQTHDRRSRVEHYQDNDGTTAGPGARAAVETPVNGRTSHTAGTQEHTEMDTIAEVGRHKNLLE